MPGRWVPCTIEHRPHPHRRAVACVSLIANTCNVYYTESNGRRGPSIRNLCPRSRAAAQMLGPDVSGGARMRTSSQCLRGRHDRSKGDGCSEYRVYARLQLREGGRDIEILGESWAHPTAPRILSRFLKFPPIPRRRKVKSVVYEDPRGKNRPPAIPKSKGGPLPWRRRRQPRRAKSANLEIDSARNGGALLGWAVPLRCVTREGMASAPGPQEVPRPWLN